MKTQPIKITTQSPKLPGIPATLIAAMLAFSVLPKTWSQSRDLFWTGGVRLTVTPADAGSGTWVLGGAWSNTRTSTGNTIWTDGSVAHFLGSNGGTATLGSFIKAAGINFDSGASAFTIDTNLNTLTIQGAGITNNSGKTQTITNSGGGFDVGPDRCRRPVFPCSMIFVNPAGSPTSTILSTPRLVATTYETRVWAYCPTRSLL